MTDPKKPKTGIVDPWRLVDPVRAPPRPRPAERTQIDLDEIDHDADLAIPGQYTIRSRHACFHISSTRIEMVSDALDVLADCIAELYGNKTLGIALEAAGIGVRTKSGAWNTPSDDESASVLKSDDAIIWFIRKPADQGMLSLARILRSPIATPTLRKHGVTVMITSS